MPIHANHTILGAVAGVRAGYPFRGAIEEVPHGAVRVIQMKDMHPLAGIRWPQVLRTRLTGRKPADWLAAGDLLFVARGTRFYAVCVDDAPPEPAVCGPHLFHLRVKTGIEPGSEVLPAFLAWQINQPPFQRELHRAAEGSNQLSVRRPVLESLPVGIPSLADQQRIVDLACLARRERQLHLQLLQNRERFFESIAESLANQSLTEVNA
jgi:hypothetical protein